MGKNKGYITVDNVFKSYNGKNVLNGISLQINKGSFFGLFGKNGAGKTTLFRHILGLASPTEGAVIIDGKTISKARDISIGYLPENIALYGHLNVVDNLKVASLTGGKDIDNNKINTILDKMNLKGSEKTLAKSLSLGMKRRLQFAMATMTKPVDILILDEPTNGMDINGVLWLKKFLNKLKKEKITILVCSHSLNFMEDLIDEYCIIKDGAIVRQDTWEKDETSNLEEIFIESVGLDEQDD